MTDAGSIRESKPSRLREPNPEKTNLSWGLREGRRERRQQRAEPRPAAPGAQEGAQRPWWRRLVGR